jgi:hypothetical protein
VLCVGVTVHVFQTGLMHVLMGVLGPILVGVGVLVRDMLVLMRGVCMRVSHIGVLVFVCVRGVMGVRLGHGRLLVRNMLWLAVFHGFVDADDSATTFSPVPSR